MSIYLYSHGGSENHGCEAIVRSTERILKRPLTLFSMVPVQDEKYGIDGVVDILPDTQCSVKKFSFNWFKSVLQIKLTGNITNSIYNSKYNMLKCAKKGDIWLSIGGDNYCYKGTEILAAENKMLHKRGTKIVLWGCSVEPEVLNVPEIAKDLSRFDLITVRESISYEALKKVNKNTVLCSDPAFTLPVGEGKMPEGFGKNPFVGINVSPLIQKSESKDGITIENYRALVKYILENTENDVALIPHVVWDGNDDREPLKKLYDEFKDSGRMFMVEDQNCTQLKAVISKCRFFIGARTHATIAAYSTCVPTLVVGYSVKAKGIAKDIFGTYDNYVLPVQSLKEKDDLTNAFKWLENNEAEIKNHLTEIMPAYIEKAYTAGAEIERLLK